MFVVDMFVCKEIGEEDALGGDDDRRILSVFISDEAVEEKASGLDGGVCVGGDR